MNPFQIIWYRYRNEHFHFRWIPFLSMFPIFPLSSKMLRCFLASQELIAAVWSFSQTVKEPGHAIRIWWYPCILCTFRSTFVGSNLSWFCHAQDPQTSSVCASSECSCSQLNAGLAEQPKPWNLWKHVLSSIRLNEICSTWDSSTCSSSSHVGHSYMARFTSGNAEKSMICRVLMRLIYLFQIFSCDNS